MTQTVTTAPGAAKSPIPSSAIAAPVANDLGEPRFKLAVALEETRRRAGGRVSLPKDFLAHFFRAPASRGPAEDRLLTRMPKEVRGPIMSGWGICAPRMALRLTDEDLCIILKLALEGLDLDPSGFEKGISPELVIRWVNIKTWWELFRGAKIGKTELLAGFKTAYELELFTADWFFETLVSADGKVRGIRVVANALTGDERAEWLEKVAEAADGTKKGMLAALGWAKLVERVSDPDLFGVLDALAIKLAFKDAPPPPEDATKKEPEARTSDAPTAAVPVAQAAAAAPVATPTPTPEPVVAKAAEAPVAPPTPAASTPMSTALVATPVTPTATKEAAAPVPTQTAPTTAAATPAPGSVDAIDAALDGASVATAAKSTDKAGTSDGPSVEVTEEGAEEVDESELEPVPGSTTGSTEVDALLKSLEPNQPTGPAASKDAPKETKPIPGVVNPSIASLLSSSAPTSSPTRATIPSAAQPEPARKSSGPPPFPSGKI